MAAEQELYDTHLEAMQKVDKEITVILDTTEEEVDWIKAIELV